MQELLKKVGERIRAARKHLGLTQEQLAERAGFNVSYIGQVERALRIPSLKSLYRLATALNTTLGTLFTERDQDHSQETMASIDQERLRFFKEMDEKKLHATLELFERIHVLSQVDQKKL